MKSIVRAKPDRKDGSGKNRARLGLDFNCGIMLFTAISGKWA